MRPAALFDDDGFEDNDELYTSTLRNYPTYDIKWDGDLDGDNIINSLDSDWDGDGILNSIEFGYSTRPAGVKANANFAIDPDLGRHVTDPFNSMGDEDGDGIIDIVEDKDLDGEWDEGDETDFDLADTDGDGMEDGFEDFNRNGQVDNAEFYGNEEMPFQDGETDPLSLDSDGDGLPDRFEVMINENEFNYYITDPTVIDTDGDTISDYMELQGWDIEILWGRDYESCDSRKTRTYDDSEVILSEDGKITSDPTSVDTDGDLLSDKDEYGLSNPWLADTDYDGIDDVDEEPGNATIIEATPPEFVPFDDGGELNAYITHKKVEVTMNPKTWFEKVKSMFDYKIQVKFTVKDNAGLQSVYLWVESCGQETYYPDGATEYSVDKTFDARLDKALTNGFDVEVTVYDINSNGAEAETHVDGFLEAAWNALTAFLKALWEAIKELATALFNWIWDKITGLIDTVFKPIIDGIDRFLDAIEKKMENALIQYASTEKVSNSEIDDITDSIFNAPIIKLIMTIIDILDIISLIISPFLYLVKTLISEVVDFIYPIILSALGGEDESGIVSILDFDSAMAFIEDEISRSRSYNGFQASRATTFQNIASGIGFGFLIYMLYAMWDILFEDDDLTEVIEDSLNDILLALIFGVISLIGGFFAFLSATISLVLSGAAVYYLYKVWDKYSILTATLITAISGISLYLSYMNWIDSFDRV